MAVKKIGVFYLIPKLRLGNADESLHESGGIKWEKAAIKSVIERM